MCWTLKIILKNRVGSIKMLNEITITMVFVYIYMVKNYSQKNKELVKAHTLMQWFANSFHRDPLFRMRLVSFPK